MNIDTKFLRYQVSDQNCAISAFFIMLLFFVQENVSFSLFVLTCVYMLLFISYTLRRDNLKAVWILIASLCLVLLIVHSSDFRYGIFKFNSSLYPVNFQDYIAIFLSVAFGYIATYKNKNLLLNLINLFAFAASFWISIHAFDFISDYRFPVFNNSNWSGTLITAVNLITINLTINLVANSFQVQAGASSKNNRLNLLVLSSLVLVICVNFYLLMQTGSRSAALAFLICLVTLLTLRLILGVKNKRLGKPLTLKYVIFASAIVLLAFFLVRNTVFLDRINNLYDYSNLLRIHIYQCHWQLFLENPLLGVGMGNSAPICEARMSETIGYVNNIGYVNHAHNFILQIAADHGILGLLTVMFCIGMYCWFWAQYWHLIRNEGDAENGSLLSIYVTVFALGFLSLFQSSVYHVPFLQLWLGVLLGTAIAATRSKLKAATR